MQHHTKETPRIVAADRGYGTEETEDDLATLGVKTIAITAKGKPTKEQQKTSKQRSFQQHVKWRTGIEGQISCLKRNYGWSQSKAHDLEGTRTWCGYGVISRNLTKIAGLLAE